MLARLRESLRKFIWWGAVVGAVVGAFLALPAFVSWRFLEMIFLWDDTGGMPHWYGEGIQLHHLLVIIPASATGGALSGARIAWRINRNRRDGRRTH